MNVVLATTYFGPVQWYQKLCRAEAAGIDADEPFQKQSYRNRCYIAAANGVQALTVPVEKARLTRDVRISDHGDWRRNHWNAIVSAYGESPFFEFYQDDLRPFYEQRWEFLYDFNEAIRQVVCDLIDIQPSLSGVGGYGGTEVREHLASHPISPSNYSRTPVPPYPRTTDYRTAINPKHPAPDPDFQPKPYYQVYASRYGFQPNLSVLDLLLNMGPESIFYL